MNENKICIIGAGNGGRAFAVYLSQLGYNVSLVYRTEKNIESIKLTKRIISKGQIKGQFVINKVTQNYKKAITDAKLVLIVLPASIHKQITYYILPYLSDDQIILLNPGRTWGAVEVYNIIKQFRPGLNIHVGETQTLVFTSRKIEDYGVEIFKIKNKVDYCFYPESSNIQVKYYLKKIFPQLRQVQDIRITSLNNIGAIVHPATVLLNLGAIIRKNNFLFYKEGATREVANIIEKIDKERCKILKTIGINPVTYLEWVKQSYNVKASSYFEAFNQIPSYKTITAPKKLRVRYITEDVPTGLVPLSSIAKYIGLECPAIDSIITLANLSMNKDYYKIGRAIENVNLPNHILFGKDKEIFELFQEMDI